MDEALHPGGLGRINNVDRPLIVQPLKGDAAGALGKAQKVVEALA